MIGLQQSGDLYDASEISGDVQITFGCESHAEASGSGTVIRPLGIRGWIKLLN